MTRKLSYKQKAYNEFVIQKGEFYENNSPFLRKDFERLWKEIRSYSRKEKMASVNEFNIQKNTQIMLGEYLSYGSSKYKSYLKKENENISFEEQYKFAVKDSYLGRTQKFFEKYGAEEYDGVLLNEWFQRFIDGNISKDEMNEIIKNFQDTNEEYQKQTYHGKHDININRYGAK